MEQSIYLVLENGTVFTGKSFGACAETTGEVVFSTAMSGYLETLTDPAFYGQIVLQTFPLIGNYGVIAADFESDSPKVRAYIVREWCHDPSNFRCEGDLDAFLKSKNVVGMYGIDTRKLTKLIRENGVMNARITTELPEDLTALCEELKAFRIEEPVKAVTCAEKVEYKVEGAKKTVAVWDLGAKNSLIADLNALSLNVIRVPAAVTAEELLALGVDGVVLSDGPGDPAENAGVIAEVKKVFDAGVPMFGIGLGHLILALSQGASSVKMQYGHRGANQPVKDQETGKVHITSQYHGYVLETLPENAQPSFINVNDLTNEGLVYTGKPAMSIQFNPKAFGLDVYSRFVNLMN